MVKRNTFRLLDNLFAHNKSNLQISLASVRPANPKTLWHTRFSDANTTGGIVRIARTDIYKDRGLNITSNLNNA